MAIKNDFPVF